MLNVPAQTENGDPLADNPSSWPGSTVSGESVSTLLSQDQLQHRVSVESDVTATSSIVVEVPAPIRGLASEFDTQKVLESQGFGAVNFPTPRLLEFDWFHAKHREAHKHIHTFAGNEDASLSASVFSLFNSSVGASTLGMPLATSLMGWLPGSFAMIFVAAGGLITARMLIRVAAVEDCKSYDKAIERVLGKFWLHVFQVFMVLSTMGSLIAYIILIGDFMVSLWFWFTGTDLTPHRNAVVAIAACGIIFPLTLMRRVTSLVFISFLSAIFVFVLAAVLLFRAVTVPASPTFTATHTSLSHMFQALPILVLAFSNQTSVLPVYREMKQEHRNDGGFGIVANITYFLVFLLYFTVGVCGFALFGTSVNGNVLNSFTDKHDYAAAFVVASYLFKILFTYPMSNYPLRVTLHYLLCGESEATTKQHFLETLAPFAVALFVGLYVRNVGFMFSFVGAVSRTSVFFLYPCALVLKCTRIGALSKSELVITYILFVVGVLIMVLGVWSSILSVT